MSAYYNESDPFAAAWLRELIADGLIADGIVDQRSIVDVQPSDLAGFRQVHFFAGIGGWSLALRLAGLPDDRPVWTGSCPCQPFSTAGKQRGTADERHLWPEMFRLIRECRPSTVFGEQVEAAVRLGWVDGVRADLEREGYAFGFHVLGAHSVEAPHIRQRIYWVADSQGERRRWRSPDSTGARGRCGAENCGPNGRLADTASTRHAESGRRTRVHGDGQDQNAQRRFSVGESSGSGELDRMEHAPSNGREQGRAESIGRSIASGCGNSGLGDTGSTGLQERIGDDGIQSGEGQSPEMQAAELRGPWSDSTTILCRDGKRRRIPTKPELFPLAHGVPNRVGTLRGAGNAIVPQVAAEFVMAFMETKVAT